MGPGLGIAGSAWATVVAQSGGAAIYLVVLVRAAQRHGVSFAPTRSGLRDAAASGFALFIRTVSLRAVLVVTTAIAARLGDPEIAAHQVVFQLWSLLVFTLDAIAIAGQSIVGRYLGASDVPGAREVTRRMVEWGIMIGAVFTVLVLAVRPWAWIPFTDDPHVRDLILAALIVVALLQPLSGVVMVLDGILMGAGDQRYLAWASLWTMLIFLPCAALVPLFAVPGSVTGLVLLWSAFGVWIAARGVFPASGLPGPRGSSPGPDPRGNRRSGTGPACAVPRPHSLRWIYCRARPCPGRVRTAEGPDAPAPGPGNDSDRGTQTPTTSIGRETFTSGWSRISTV